MQLKQSSYFLKDIFNINRQTLFKWKKSNNIHKKQLAIFLSNLDYKKTKNILKRDFFCIKERAKIQPFFDLIQSNQRGFINRRLLLRFLVNLNKEEIKELSSINKFTKWYEELSQITGLSEKYLIYFNSRLEKYFIKKRVLEYLKQMLVKEEIDKVKYNIITKDFHLMKDKLHIRFKSKQDKVEPEESILRFAKFVEIYLQKHKKEN